MKRISKEKIIRMASADSVQSVFMRLSLKAYFDALTVMTGNSRLNLCYEAMLSITKAFDGKKHEDITIGEMLHLAADLFMDNAKVNNSFDNETNARLIVKDILITPLTAVRGNISTPSDKDDYDDYTFYSEDGDEIPF
ncbi:MAG: hypothetical protein IJ561_08650 [Ruminococcus sp.]|nr:hypothetical protein [Ruminococcus sp.]